MANKLPSIRVFGNPQKYTGYGNATFNLGSALSESSVKTRFEFWGPNASCVNNFNNFNGAPEIDLYIQTPPFSGHRSNNYKIGYFYWEADALPKVWAKDIRTSVNELWVPCNITASACRKAGFKGPIEILPTPAKIEGSLEAVQFPSELSREFVLSENIFKFYSIFQWNERKGYNQLLRGYLEEFSSKEDVILILKVNPIKHAGHGLNRIKADIIKAKTAIGRKKSDLPKIFVITDNLSHGAIAGIHNACDAFVLPHRGEGWGMPIHDAMMYGSHIIVTKYGGITEYLTDENSFIIDHEIKPVKPMSWNPWYESHQRWAYPSTFSLKKNMRDLYAGRERFSSKLDSASKLINLFTIEKCSKNVENILKNPRFNKFK
jgi:glycosyltransferase involved in cell wall biosynthesis